MLDPLPLRVATFNIRNTNDRYHERKPLLRSTFADLQPDIIGLQAVVFGAEQQPDLLAAALPASPFMSFDARSSRDREFGNAILCRVGEVMTHEELRLSNGRVAHRILVLLPGNRTLWFANTHLHHRADGHHVRARQAEAIVRWMLDAPRANATIVAGDFNAYPADRAVVAVREAGFRSAHVEVHGAEPDRTRPSGIQASTADLGGPPGCVDYLWLYGECEATGASVGANQPHPDDPTLFASDHIAVTATIVLS